MIKTKGLKKSYKIKAKRQTTEVEAVKGIDLDVAEGEIFGFLGPNGAGKTTTLRMLATLIPPDDGEASIAGANLRSEPAAVRRAIGFVAQGGSTTDDVTAREELILQARMYGMSRAEAARRAGEVIASFELTEFADRKCKTYSGGQRRRLDIALGVIHGPQVLFLDEPTTGLDPQSRAHMWDEVRRLRAEGMTVFITTHYLDEADALCDRIAIIDHGEIVAEGTPEALKREISGDVVTVGVGDPAANAADKLAVKTAAALAEAATEGAAAEGAAQSAAAEGAAQSAAAEGASESAAAEAVESVPVKAAGNLPTKAAEGLAEKPAVSVAEKAAEVLKGQPFARDVEVRDDGELRLTVESGDTAIPQIMRALEGAGIALTTIELHRPTLDDVFLTKTGRSLRD